jgi:hypothetical protein
MAALVNGAFAAAQTGTAAWKVSRRAVIREEQNDLAVSKPEKAKEMLTQLKNWFADTQKTATPQSGGWIQQ